MYPLEGWFAYRFGVVRELVRGTGTPYRASYRSYRSPEARRAVPVRGGDELPPPPPSDGPEPEPLDRVSGRSTTLASARYAARRSARSASAEMPRVSVAGTRNCHAQLPRGSTIHKSFRVVARNRPRVWHPSPSDFGAASYTARSGRALVPPGSRLGRRFLSAAEARALAGAPCWRVREAGGTSGRPARGDAPTRRLRAARAAGRETVSHE